ncbi:hypothetical protein C9F11_05135 [Streptomyces sp. YIM 121038]|uniref:hypothetical protein n=1 Tax=Streptomyces sp. YIM 121038 TaxID=2136401 RepID=UPI0011105AD3|nr:hypothetical protein [Streptomyces sp. YIM 121038]QCX74730.1 hypothetical protein C9F11_05135 [Streptomyces sp. YIM 121038]
MLTPEEVRDLLAPLVVGKWDEGGRVVLEVTDLEVVVSGRKFDVYLGVVAPDGRWSVRSERDNSDINVFNGSPPEGLVTWIARSLRIELFEWWHTKAKEAYARKQGVRLDG